jgi:hypothetical protein
LTGGILYLLLLLLEGKQFLLFFEFVLLLEKHLLLLGVQLLVTVHVILVGCALEGGSVLAHVVVGGAESVRGCLMHGILLHGGSGLVGVGTLGTALVTEDIASGSIGSL